MATATFTNILHRVLHKPLLSPQPKLISSFFTYPLFTSTNKVSIFLKTPLHHPTKPSSLFTPFSSLSSSTSLSLPQEHDYGGEESEIEDVELEEISEVSESDVGLKRESVTLPTLSVKEKKELASYAHGLGKKLKCQIVGKSGVTDGVVSSFIENLEANELLKIQIRRTCPGEFTDVVQHLEKATGSVVVGQIGRTIIIYRPSLTKLKAEEKKRQDRKVYMRRAPELKANSLARMGKNRALLQQQREEAPRSRRGHRGSSRMQTTA